MATLSSTGRFAAGEACADNDILYGPYATVAAAHAALLNAEQNVIGRTVGIQTGNTIEEYWYQGGTEQANLVKKQTAVEVDATPTQSSPNAVSSGGVYTALQGKANTSDIPSVPAISTNIESDANSDTKTASPKAVKTFVEDKGYLTQHQDISGKADKVNNATNGNFAGLDANGNLTNSTYKAGDFATAAQGAKADSAIQGVKKNGVSLEPDANKIVDVPVDIVDAHATPVPYNQSASATIDQDKVLQLEIPQGTPGHNPNLGTFLDTDSANWPPSTDIQDGDYIIVVHTDSSTPTKTIYLWDGDSWEDTREEPTAIFASGEVVSNVHIINDPMVGGDHDLFTAQQGFLLNEKVFGEGKKDFNVNVENASSGHPAQTDGSYGSNSGYFRRYTVDLTGKYAEGYRKIRFYGFNYQTTNIVCNGLVGTAIDQSTNNITVENYIKADTNYVDDWFELPITENSIVFVGTIMTSAGAAALIAANYNNPNFVPTFVLLKTNEVSINKRVSLLEEGGLPFKTGELLKNTGIADDLLTESSTDLLTAKQGNRLYSILNAKTEKKSVDVVVGQVLTSYRNLYNDVSLPIGSFIKIKLIKVTEYLSQFQIVNESGSILTTISSFSNGDEFVIMLPTSTTKIGLYIGNGDYVIASGAVELEFTVNYQSSVSYQISDLPNMRSNLIKKVALGTGKNLFDKNVIDSGYYLYRGRVLEQSSYRTSYYIEVKEQTYYTQSPQQNNVSVHFYDKNLRYIGYSDNPGTFQTPSGTKFIRTSMIAASLDSTQIEEGQEATLYEVYNPLFKYSASLVDVQQNVLFNLKSSLLKDGTNNDFVNVKKAISNVRIWGLQNGSVFGISYINTQITTSKGQLFFNLITSDGTNYKCHYMFDNSIINNNGSTYFTIYRDNLSCYPSDYNKSVLPSEIRLSIDFSKIGADHVGFYNPNTAYLPFSELVCNEFENPYTLLNEGGSSDVYITCKRIGTSGVDADFCGLNAIGDAVAAITDAGEDKQYYIMIEGHFLFTDPRMVEDGGDFKYKDGGEPSIIIAKKYIHFVGVDKSRAVIEVNLDASLVPNTTDFAPKDGGGYLDFTDYQPIYIRQSCHAKNITFIGTNDRYTVHVETNNIDKGLDIHFENCDIISRVSTKGYKACMVVGEVPYSRIKMENCNFINDNNSFNCTLFSGHTPLSNITNGRENCSVEFDGCYFMTVGNIGLGTYNYNRKDVEIFKNCSFHPLVNIVATSNSSSRKIIGTLVDQRFSNNPLPFHTKLGNVYGLRVTTTVGDTSSVRFDKDCSAFGIIGDVNDETVVTLPWSATKQYGYEYKDDANGSHAYACGWINVYNSLGTLLGDCSITSKTLRIIINGTNYDVDFTTDLTNESDENIIDMINDVISAVAICDTFDPEANVYPQFDGEDFFITNGDSSVIERGMGVVKTSYNVIRKAKQSDGYIDGIAVDTIYPGQVGRIITKGKLWSNNSNDANHTYHYLNINPIITSGLSYGVKLSINPNEDGKFVISNSAPVLKCIGNQIIEII